MIAVLIVDDHPVVREGYKRLLERIGEFRIAGEADAATSAYELYRRLAPDVVIMDLALQGASGLEAVRHIRQWDPRAKILVCSVHGTASFALKSFEAGASGFVTKSGSPKEFVEAVRTVAQGGRALGMEIAHEIASERLVRHGSALNALGPRETEILRQIASGATDLDIARALNLSLKTVQNYHYRIKDKVRARTDAQLVWFAVEAGLVKDKTTA
jgi:DNA-binding NarL/FixJ family response regulator